MQVFRKATIEDIRFIVGMELDTFHGPWSENSIRDTLESKQAFLAVAEVDGNLEGYCIVYHSYDYSEIARIAVRPNVRRSGIGRGLMEFVCEQCRELQKEQLLLEVRSSNETARKFYSGYGFKEDGVRKNYYDCPKEDAILMSLTL